MSGSRPGRAAPSHSTLQMSVANMTFMVDRLGADCAPGQFVRELTENAIAAIEALPDRRGDVIWDADWNTHMLVGRYKLCAVDTGIGMTGPEMVQYINNLSSSIHEQTNSTNFGVGAKVSAAPHNHAGILYLSWKDGVGSMIHLWRDPVANVYGLKQFERPDGTFDHWAYIENTVKPEAIQNNGTMVILLGNTEEQNTMEPPAGLPMPAKWILRYLNSRYYRFPSGIVVRVREGWTLPKTDSRHNFLRVADGMEAWLRDNAEDSGTVDLTGAKAHWWILKADVDVNSGHYTPPGHVGALYQDELYDLSTSRAGVARLQSLGVIFGHSRVVLYVEPDASGQRVEANTARTSLSINGEPLPWSEWASEFRDSFPQPLRQLVEEVGSKAAGSDHRQSIRERLKSILDLFKLPRYRPAKSGEVNIDPDSLMGGGRPRRQGGAGGEGESSSGGRGGRGGSIYGLFLAVSGIPGEEAPVKGEPERKWVSVEKGTRTAGDMDDRAAKFIAQQNLLLINEDFRGFTDHVRYWTEKYEHAPGSGSVVQEVVHEWFEQQLVEAVLGAQSLRDSPEWNMSLLEQLWSPEALTAVVLPRYHINLAIGRALGAKLGSLRDRVA